MGTLDDYRKRPHWSFSALNQFVNICSLQYAFQRIYLARKEFTPVTLSFGSAFHRCMEYVGLVRKENKVPVRKDAEELFSSLWERQVREDADIRYDEGMSAEDYAEEGRALVACAVEAIDPEERVLAVNEAFAVPMIDMAGHSLDKPLIGEMDWIVEKDMVRCIVDWKTSARRWPKDKARKDMQATAFLYAYRQLFGMECSFRFDVVVKNKTPVFEQHPAQRQIDDFLRFIEITKRVESMIASEHFLPNEQGFYCSGCPYTQACKAWHRSREKFISFAA